MTELIYMIGQYVCFFILHVCGGGSFPKPLGEKRESELIEKMRLGDSAARNTLIEHNLRLVAHIIKKYGAAGDGEELVSVGTIGLIKGIDSFKPEKKIKLSSYVSRCIENEILMHFRRLKKTERDVSLSETIDTDKDGNPLTLMEIIAVDDTIIDDLDLKLNKSKLQKFILEELSERERLIIIMRYGLDGKKPLTQKKAAALLGISRSYVSRIETKALKKLRKRYDGQTGLG